MKKNYIVGSIAAVTLSGMLMAVPVMAQTGAYMPPAQAATHTAAPSGITKDQAIDIALKQARVTKKNAQYLNAYQDYEDGRPTFEVKFYVGMTEYHYEIDAVTGQIFDTDIDMEDYDMDFFDD